MQNALSDAGIPDAEMQIMYGGASDSEDTSASRLPGRWARSSKNCGGKADYVILDTAPAELLVDAVASRKICRTPLCM